MQNIILNPRRAGEGMDFRHPLRFAHSVFGTTV